MEYIGITFIIMTFILLFIVKKKEGNCNKIDSEFESLIKEMKLIQNNLTRGKK